MLFRPLRAVAVGLCAATVAVTAAAGPAASPLAASTPAPAEPAAVSSGYAAATTGEDARSVYRLYRAYFLREPDAAGLAYWEQLRARGVPLDQISGHFAASAEFRYRYGALDNRGFVTLVYRNVLRRAPEAGGFAYWVGMLGGGLTRGRMMIGFSDSAEYKTLLTRLAAPAPAPAPTDPTGKPTAPAGTYAFTASDSAGPVRWDPCTPIAVVANFDGAPPGARDVLVDVLAKLSAAHRITWRFEGTTTERYDTIDAAMNRPGRDPARYGDRYSPVLVSWPRTWDPAHRAAGYGGLSATSVGGGRQRAVTGGVILNSAYGHTRAELTHLLLHELGHVANLAHVPDPAQVMAPGLRTLTGYQNGDRAGLAAVGGWDATCAASVGSAAGTSGTVSSLLVADEPGTPFAAGAR